MASGYVLIHKACGHPLALSAHRANLAPYTGPDAEVRFAIDRDIEAFAAGTRCGTCSTPPQTSTHPTA